MGLVQIKTSVLGKKGKGRLSGHATPRAQPDPRAPQRPQPGQDPSLGADPEGQQSQRGAAPGLRQEMLQREVAPVRRPCRTRAGHPSTHVALCRAGPRGPRALLAPDPSPAPGSRASWSPWRIELASASGTCISCLMRPSSGETQLPGPSLWQVSPGRPTSGRGPWPEDMCLPATPVSPASATSVPTSRGGSLTLSLSCLLPPALKPGLPPAPQPSVSGTGVTGASPTRRFSRQPGPRPPTAATSSGYSCPDPISARSQPRTPHLLGHLNSSHLEPRDARALGPQVTAAVAPGPTATPPHTGLTHVPAQLCHQTEEAPARCPPGTRLASSVAD